MKSRAYVFTHNNYENTEFEDTIKCEYIIYGKEIGESGTPHLQGYIRFKNQRSFKAVQKLMQPRHIEPARSVQQAIDYCKKDGDFTERGTPPTDGGEAGGNKEKRRWADAFEAAKEGRFNDIPADIRMRQYNTIKRIRTDALNEIPLVDTEEPMEWYWGESGTGKSRKAREENPGAYIKTCNKWWDGYQAEDVVIIEDFDKSHADKLVYHLKIWADRYPFRAEYKGGSMMMRPKKIIVTSNYHPEQLWETTSDLGPILRRFKITCFKRMK